MRNYQSKLLILILAILTSQGLQAGEVTTTFSEGLNLTDTHMTEIKDAVNDNDANATALDGRTTTLESDVTALEADVTALDIPSSAVGQVQLSGSTISTTAVSIDSFTVTAPATGSLFVLVNGEIWLDADATTTSALDANYRLGLCEDATTSTCAGTYNTHDYQDADNASSTNSTFGFTKTRVIPVTEGISYTFHLVGNTSNATYTLNLYNSPEATVVFIPGSLIVTSP